MKIENRFFLLIIVCVFVVFTGCPGSTPQDPANMVLSISSTPTDGTELEGLDTVLLDIEGIEVIIRDVEDDPSTERRVEIPIEPRSINLLGLGEGVSRIIGIYQIEPGYLTQMRFIARDAQIAFEQEEITDVDPSISLSLAIPSGEQTGVKIVPADGIPIEVIDQQTFFWEIQFDPSHQIVVNSGRGYALKPVLKASLLQTQSVSPVVSDQILVTFREGVARGEIDALNEEIGAAVVGFYEPLNLYLMEFSGLSYEGAKAFYEASDKVAEAAPSVILTPSQTANTPDDPSFSSQWSLNNTGQTGGTYDADIDAPEAWAQETGDYYQIVAVLDTGAQLDHPDLYSNIFINSGELPDSIEDADWDGIITFDDLNDPSNSGAVADSNSNGFIDGEDLIASTASGGLADGVDDDSNGSVDDLVGMNFSTLAEGGLPTNDPSDDKGHGTSVSGIIGAIGDNSEKIAGINWRVRILPIKVCDSGGACPDISVRAGMQYAVDMAADVANLSLGATFINDPAGAALINSFTNFLNAIGSDATLIVVAAGNEAVDCDKSTIHCFLAEVDVPHLIGIAATTDKDERASYSNYGDNTIPLAAPGHSILTLNRFSGTTWVSGTSFAAPHVSGAAGLVFSLDPSLFGDPAAVISRIENGADSISSLNGLVEGGRRLNASGAL